MHNIFTFLTRNRWMKVISLSFIICHFSISSVGAQSLYEQNLRMGEMFYQSGCMKQAEKYYQTAIENADAKNKQQWLAARLQMINLLKFWRPVEARNLNEEIAEECKAYPALHQKSLALNAAISFWLDSKDEFKFFNDEYLRFSNQTEGLPTVYDKPLQAMSEALNGYYNQALNTIEQHIPASVLRHELRLRIFQMKGDDKAIIREMQLRTATIDSLCAVNYNTNLNEASTISSMTVAQQQAEKRSSRMLMLSFLMGLIILSMFALWVYLHRRNQKKLENKNEQLSTALKMASETDQMKSEFVKRVSHEIRTPLNAITGFNEILNNPDIPLPQEERQELIERISENVKAITGIVDELLQVANTESTQDYARYDTVLCNQFLSNLIYSHREEVKADIELRYTTKVINRFSIQTNQERLEKIIEHLIDNAIKFTQHGFIELNCTQKDDTVEISLTDTGCGIPADKQDDIFEEFVKADAFRQGIGLGLTVSRKMAQKMGGNLQLDKTYTTGARFVLTLPIQ